MLIYLNASAVLQWPIDLSKCIISSAMLCWYIEMYHLFLYQSHIEMLFPCQSHAVPLQWFVSHVNPMPIIPWYTIDEDFKVNGKDTTPPMVSSEDNVGLQESQYVSVYEQVIMFLHMVGHNCRNYLFQDVFQHSRKTVVVTFTPFYVP